ncbi:MAG: radical SAM protein, partial [Candidatus Omnitrophota bacterium]
FCSQRSITGKRYTARSPEKVTDDIELLITRYEQKVISFLDDSFLIDKVRAKAICDLIRQRGLHKKASFECQVRLDELNDDILKCFKETNFVLLCFGLETASENLMALIKKGVTVRKNIEAMTLARKYGFRLAGTFIFGLPTETKEDRQQAYKMAREFLDYVRFNNATPYPGTKLYEMAKEEKRLNVGKNWENLNACGTLARGPFSKERLAYVPLGTTEIELKKDVLKYNLFFSFRWRVIHDLLGSKKGIRGWFRMPSQWYLNGKEWRHLICLCFKVAESWVGLFVLMLSSALTTLRTVTSENNDDR